MKIFPKLIISFLALYSTITLAALTPEISENKVKIYTENNVNIVLDSKQPEFILQLKSNPTTGYSWFLREYNSDLIVPIKHSFKTAEKNLIGASGYEIWAFQMKPAGFMVPQQTMLRMVYARPWEIQNGSGTQIVFRISTQAR